MCLWRFTFNLLYLMLERFSARISPTVVINKWQNAKWQNEKRRRAKSISYSHGVRNEPL